MRRFLALIAIPLLACLVLAGCGGSSKSIRLLIVIRILLGGRLPGREHLRYRNRRVRQDAEGDHPEGHAG